jgi:hypothetical protein
MVLAAQGRGSEMPILDVNASTDPAADEDLSKYGAALSNDVHPSVTLHGSAKTGKTISALRASALWNTPQVDLEDTVLVGYDHNPESGLAQFKKRVLVLRINEIMSEKGFEDVRLFERAWLFPFLHKLYHHQSKRVFIFDAVSTRWDLVAMMLHRDARSAAEERGKGKNNFDVWTQGKADSAAFCGSALQFSKSTTIFTCHSQHKALQEALPGDSPSTIERKTLSRQVADPVGHKVGLMLPGQIGEPFINHSDLILAQRMVLDPKGSGFSRFILTRDPDSEYRANSRYSDWLDPEEPADVGHIINKIRIKKAEALAPKE